MRKLLLGLTAALALPTLLAAQTPPIPNDASSPTAKDKVTLHRQNPQRGPADEASQTAQDKVAEHRATQRRGEVVGLDHRPTWIAKPPAQRAQPGVSRAVPPATRPPQPAMPAQPPAKPSDPGQSGNHRP